MFLHIPQSSPPVFFPGSYRHYVDACTGAAKSGIGAAAQEYLLAVLAQPKGLFPVHQQEAEHHLHAQQQGVKVPIDGRLVQQLNMIAGRNAAKGRHTLAVQIPGIFVDQVAILYIAQKRLRLCVV